MEIYQILSLIGVPSLCAAVVIYIVKTLKKQHNETEALKLGVQALLRAQMINDYNKWSERGYAPIYAKENFENCWKQYEALGKNGVMLNIYKRFIELPTEEAKYER